MNEDNFFDLVNRKIDGETSVTENESIEAYLADHPEVDSRYEELTGLSKLLAKAKDAVPPDGLKRDILNEIASRKRIKSIQEVPSQSWIQCVVHSFNYRYAVTFVSGLAAGIALFVLSTGVWNGSTDWDTNGARGTMMPSLSIDSFHKIERQELIHEGISGHIETRLSDTHLMVILYLSSENNVNVTLAYDGSKLPLTGFQQMCESSDRLRVESNRVLIPHTGECEYYLIFDDGAKARTNLSVALECDGNVFSHVLEIRNEDK